MHINENAICCSFGQPHWALFPGTRDEEADTAQGYPSRLPNPSWPQPLLQRRAHSKTNRDLNLSHGSDLQQVLTLPRPTSTNGLFPDLHFNTYNLGLQVLYFSISFPLTDLITNVARKSCFRNTKGPNSSSVEPQA